MPDRLRAVLDDTTATAWQALAGVLPDDLYLGGGTALAVHLGHRISRDLDFFYHRRSVDLAALEDHLRAAGTLAVSERAPGTLNAIFADTKVQFLHADEGRPQHLLEKPQTISGLRVAGIRDIAAMKLNAISARGELRDYYDLQVIEQRARYPMDQALGDYLERYEPGDPQALRRTITALGYLDDVLDDPGLPVSHAQIAAYWRERQPSLIRAAGRQPHPTTTPSSSVGASLTAGGPEPSPAGRVWIQAHTRRGRIVRGHWRHSRRR